MSEGKPGQTRTEPIDRAMELIDLLANQVGPRRPTTRAERVAAIMLREDLERRGLNARVEPFAGYSSFAWPFGVILLSAVLPALLPPRMRRTRSALALGAAAGVLSEGGLRFSPLSRLLARRRSGNVVAAIEPRGRPRRTLCLMAHLDSSRSGLIFHPRVVAALGPWISAQSVGVLAAAAAEPLVGGGRRGGRMLLGVRAMLLAGLGLLVEREVRGVDVPGANDNASGCAVAATLAAEALGEPLEETRLVLLLTGCEESGTLGARAFLAQHDTEDWLFLNIDNVGGGGSVRFLRREGVLAKWHADEALAALAEEIAGRRPELRLAPEDSPAGLTYDSSPVLAAGGRALTLSVQDGHIPNLHRPTDTYENVERDGVYRTLEAAREMVRSIDAGAVEA